MIDIIPDSVFDDSRQLSSSAVYCLLFLDEEFLHNIGKHNDSAGETAS